MIPRTLVSLRAPLTGPVFVLPSSAAPDERVRAEAAAMTRARRTPSALATPHCVRSRTHAHSSAPGQLHDHGTPWDRSFSHWCENERRTVRSNTSSGLARRRGREREVFRAVLVLRERARDDGARGGAEARRALGADGELDKRVDDVRVRVGARVALVRARHVRI
jgi:hypothetical protein